MSIESGPKEPNTRSGKENGKPESPTRLTLRRKRTEGGFLFPGTETLFTAMQAILVPQDNLYSQQDDFDCVVRSLDYSDTTTIQANSWNVWRRDLCTIPEVGRVRITRIPKRKKNEGSYYYVTSDERGKEKSLVAQLSESLGLKKSVICEQISLLIPSIQGELVITPELTAEIINNISSQLELEKPMRNYGFFDTTEKPAKKN